MKLSNKDLLILLGIAVAVIITLTTLVYTDTTVKKASLPEAKKTSFNHFASEILKKVVSKTESPFSISRY
jgi:cell division protein FtsN